MDEQTARGIAQASPEKPDLPPAYVLRGATRRIIELGEQPAVGARVRDVRVWVVRFQAGIAWCELAVDEATGQVVRVQRSRAR